MPNGLNGGQTLNFYVALIFVVECCIHAAFLDALEGQGKPSDSP